MAQIFFGVLLVLAVALPILDYLGFGKRSQPVTEEEAELFQDQHGL